jgi:hypothetical protein
MALVVVVLVMLAVTALAHGLLTLSRFEYQAARAGEDHLASRLAAEAGVRLVLLEEFGSVGASTPPWKRAISLAGSVGGADYSAQLVRLSRELWLAEGTGSRGGIVPLKSGLIAWRLDPVARVVSTAAAIIHEVGASVSTVGAVDSSEFLDAPAISPPGGCDEWSAALDSLLSASTVATTRAVAVGANTLLGPMSLDSLMARVPHRVSGWGTPGPVVLNGNCQTGIPWNWGDPRGTAGPCSGHMVSLASDGDLVLEGGVGQGLVIVRGDLVLTDTQFFGVLIVEGSVTISGGGRIEGVVRATDGVTIGANAAVLGSGCWAAAALASGAVRSLFTVGASWVGP